jgi:DNA-directed RNA polymerase specialized sigma subunit
LREDLQRDPTDAELAETTGMTVQQLRRRLDVGRAARNKLIKVNTETSTLGSISVHSDPDQPPVKLKLKF